MTAETTFDATSDTLANLLNEVATGRLQLPDFQRGWVWDDEHIAAVITSVARSFPIGAVMTLQTGSDVCFKARPVEGAVFSGDPPKPERLILDGQKRLTSMFQALMLKPALHTTDGKRRPADLFDYLDINKALGTTEKREQAVFSIPAARTIGKDFGREITLNLSTREQEFLNRCFPSNMVFSGNEWFTGWMKRWNYAPVEIELFDKFRSEFIGTFKSYSIPVTQWRRTASKEAVCRVFKKVNTGGKTTEMDSR
jgi:hypothetical protein